MSPKTHLHAHCRQHLQEQLRSLEAALASITDSRNNETKSSVGDKYETGRAMMQLEEEKYRVQLANTQHTLNMLDSIDPSLTKDKAELGSLVETDGGRYFLSVGLGKIRLHNELFYAISLNSPLGRALLQKRPGESIVFNQKTISILAIS